MSYPGQLLACRLNAKSRCERLREKILTRHKVSRRRELVIQQRHATRIAWWHRTYRSPLAASIWIFTCAVGLWSVILYSLGLHPKINAGTLTGTGTLFMRLER